MTEKDQKKSTADAYVVVFYKEIQILLYNYTNYKNVIKELEVTYGKESEVLSNITDAKKEGVIQVIANLSASIERTYIQYLSLCHALKIVENETIKSKYDELTDKYVMDVKETMEYIVEINKFLVEHILGSVGTNILSEVMSLYGDQ